jgi:protein involved in polysaccharide export with SLBB domain
MHSCKLIATALLVSIAASTGCDKRPADPQPAAPSTPAVTANTTAPKAPAIPELARATTQPGILQAGDWLQIEIADLVATGKTTVEYARISPAGNAAFPLLGAMHVAGESVAEAQTAAGTAYVKAKILSQPHVQIERIFLSHPGDRPATPIGPSDLVRVDVLDLNGTGIPTSVIHRVASDGTVAVPIIGPVKIAGSADDAAAAAAIAKRYVEERF